MSEAVRPAAARAAPDGGPLGLPVSHQCFVCGRDNPHGLRLRFALEGQRVSTRCRLHRDYNGFLDRAHGGVVAALLDETMGWATALIGRRFTYTVELAVRYRLPVPLEQGLEVAGWVVRHTPRLSFAAGELARGDGGERVVLATATGKFMAVSEQDSRRIADALIYDPGDLRLADTWGLDPSGDD
ncbi:MAG TPA: PaaI family thioesterase [Thermoanaerobaculia bacterium]|nr:PaaI family thioesterase [Thermoanaerobaculia bacterium]